MDDEDFKEAAKVKLSTLDDQTELLSQALQNTKEDLEENDEKVKDIVDRVEMLQQQMNRFREEWEDYKNHVETQLDEVEEGEINTSQMLSERQEALIKNQKNLRKVLRTALDNQSMLVEQLHDKHGQEMKTEKVKDTNQELMQKLTGGNTE